jgi:drug/metabolite transporter (DMT)-like permease
VCFFWGTTYLAIRMSLESIPPMKLVALRFLLSGAILLLGAWLYGAKLPRGRELWVTALFGIMVLGGGNGCLVYAETLIPSGLAAIFITISPFWMVGLEALLPGGEKLTRAVLTGMLVGFGGVLVLLIKDDGSLALSANTLKGFLLLQLGNVLWTGGSLLQKRQNFSTNPVVSGAVQQFATGLAFVVPALVSDGSVRWEMRGTLALFYLVTFGSIVGYSAFIYAMNKLPIGLVSIYPYVNPVVAVALGWLFYREPFGGREFVAMAIIFLGVFLVKRAH